MEPSSSASEQGFHAGGSAQTSPQQQQMHAIFTNYSPSSRRRPSYAGDSPYPNAINFSADGTALEPNDASVSPSNHYPFQHYGSPNTNLSSFANTYSVNPNQSQVEILGSDGTPYHFPIPDASNPPMTSMARWRGTEDAQHVAESASAVRRWQVYGSDNYTERPPALYRMQEARQPSITTSQTQDPPDSGYQSYHQYPTSDSHSQAGLDTASIPPNMEQLRRDIVASMSLGHARSHQITALEAQHVPRQQMSSSFQHQSSLMPQNTTTTDLSTLEASHMDHQASTEAHRIGDNTDWPSSSTSHSPRANRCTVRDCKNRQAMSQSDFKKHMKRHEKPYRCDVEDCKGQKGFATQNDLDRHTKSVHGKMSESANTRSFICKGRGCNHKDKVWPRLDNFKAHCTRKHHEEDVKELIKRSEIVVNNQSSIEHSASANETSKALNVNVNVNEVAKYPAQYPSGLSSTGSLLPVSSPQDYAEEEFPAHKTSSQPRDVPKLVISSYWKETDRPSTPTTASLRAQDSEQVYRNRGTSMDYSAACTSEHHSPVEQDIDEQLRSNLVADFLEAMETNQPVGIESQEHFAKSLADIAINRVAEWHRDGSRKRSVNEAGLDTQSSDPNGRHGGAASNKFPKTDLGDENEAYKVSDHSGLEIRCSICGKSFKRNCDLKKHKKRHIRPWGCTEADCDRTFGSKNDWKRHENTQHFQAEAWRCGEKPKGTNTGVCSQVFYRADPFRSHLRQEHGRTDDTYLQLQCRTRRIGRNRQTRFWCGFCKEIVKLQRTGLEAWDERFNHIDDEHFKRGAAIDDWYPIDKDLPKGQLRKDRLARKNIADGDSDSDGIDDGKNTHLKGPYPPPPAPIGSPKPILPPPLTPETGSEASISTVASPASSAGATALLGTPQHGKSASNSPRFPPLAPARSPSTVTMAKENGGEADKATRVTNLSEEKLLEAARSAYDAHEMISIAIVTDLHATAGIRVVYRWRCCMCNDELIRPRHHKVCTNCPHNPCKECKAKLLVRP